MSCMPTSMDNQNGQGGKNFRFVPIPPRILEYALRREMLVVQINAQRLFGPSIHASRDWVPQQGSEVFVGKIPRHFHEPELLPFFEQYFHPEQAKLAVNILHGAEIRRGIAIVANKSVDNRKLLLGGVPTSKTSKEIEEAVKRITEKVVHVHTTWLMPTTQTKGLVYVTYETHRAAALARKKMLSKPLELWSYKISADWAEPEPTYRDRTWLIPQVLCVRNLSPDIKSKFLREIFLKESCKGVKRMKRFGTEAYIYFKTRGQAELAKMALNGATVNGIKIQVEWSNPNLVPFHREERAVLRRRAGVFTASTTTIINSQNFNII